MKENVTVPKCAYFIQKLILIQNATIEWDSHNLHIKVTKPHLSVTATDLRPRFNLNLHNILKFFIYLTYHNENDTSLKPTFIHELYFGQCYTLNLKTKKIIAIDTDIGGNFKICPHPG